MTSPQNSTQSQAFYRNQESTLSEEPNSIKTGVSDGHPKVALENRKFVCNGKAVDIGRKPTASRLLKAFIQTHGHALNKGQIMEAMGGESLMELQGRSKRFLSCKSQSLNRLISRLRSDFRILFRSYAPEGIQWFYYDQVESIWLLYKLPGEGANRKLYA
ncbi:MAG: hypothetical protein NT027_10805 [Proteobacteria bacterium]|nr:hypothetical protein [Pseudomonadota bacterium]